MRANRQNTTILGRLLALLLVLAMTASMALESSALALDQPDDAAADQQEETLEEAPEAEVPDQPAGEETAEEPSEPEQPEEPGEEELPAAPEGEDAGTDSPEPEPETPEQEPVPEESEADQEVPAALTEDDPYALEVTAVRQLTLAYDDRYDFAELAEGYVVYSIQTEKVTSYQVSGGSKSSRLDTDVLRLEQDSQTKVIAAGVGSATVLLVPEAQTTGLGGAIQVTVTVKAAKLTVIFVAGQSNAEGCCSQTTGYKVVDSVACPEGQVYSTYLPKTASHGWNIARISKSEYSEDAQAIVAGSLTGTKSRNGTELNYPLNALTEKGQGKTGPDSGIAYEWNRLTGDKVWIINAASSASSVSAWKQGGSCYTRALSVYQAAVKTLDAEVSAGHYTKGNRLMFWLQGESDKDRSASEYLTDFDSMHQGFDNALSIQYFGLISVRSSQGSYTNSEDLYMNGPRIAQYYMANSSSSQYSDVYVVSNVNEQWVTDSGVSSYFRSAYSGGKLTYPLRSGTNLSGLPTTVSQVHGDIHYAQVAHNENGLTAARNMYYLVKGKGSSSVSVTWRNAKGKEIDRPLSVKTGASTVVVPVVEPLYCSKQVSYKVSSSVLSYTASSGTLKGNSTGTASLQARNASGTQIASLSVTVANLPAPTLLSIANQSDGVRVAWEKVSGATSYIVYRKTDGTDWKQIGTTTGSNYTDTTAVSGTSYTYTVRACKGSTRSAYDTKGLSIDCLSPTTFKLTNVSSGVQITWEKIQKADGYYVYRRPAGGSWSKLTTISSASTLTYTDTGAVSGTSYEYAVAGRLKQSRSAYTGTAWVWLSEPVLSGTRNVEDGLYVSWKKVTGAESYRVYRKTDGTNWKQIGTSTSLGYTDTSAISGSSYTYTVRAAKGSTLSSYDTEGLSFTYLAATTFTLTNTASGVQISWNQIAQADGYNVYRRSDGGSWTKIAVIRDPDTLSCTDTEVTSGASCEYTVAGWMKNIQSGYTAAAWVWLSVPELTGVQNAEKGLTVSWQTVTGATGYYVFRKSDGSGWSRIATVSGGTKVSYTDTTTEPGTTYTYTARAIQDKYSSFHDTQGVSALRVQTPEITSVKNSELGVRIAWDEISGATEYVVYRKEEGANWIRLAAVTDTGYTDTDTLESGRTYLYTLRAQVEETLSGYQISGSSILYLDTPQITKTANTTKGIQITWDQVTGAENYVIYRKNGSSWTRLGTTTGTSYTDTSELQSGTTYCYTLRAAKGQASSGYRDAGTDVLWLATPELLQASSGDEGIQISWREITGADSYRIYRRSGDSGWVGLGTVLDTSYTDADVSGGVTYTYTVRAVNEEVLSDYDHTGLSATAQ